jgi:hypothetical protein
MHSTDLAQNTGQWMTLVNTVIRLGVPYNFGKCLNREDSGGFSRRA